VSEAWRRAVGQYRRSVNAQRKRDQRDLENGSFWDRIDWSHVRVVLMGAKPGSGSLLSLLPDSVVREVLLTAARRRWRPSLCPHGT